MGNACKPMAVSFQCMTKFTTNKKKKKNWKGSFTSLILSPAGILESPGELLNHADAGPHPQKILQFNSVQLLSHVQLFMTPWTAAHQASLFITNSQSSLKLMSIKLVMTSNHLLLCHLLLFLPSIFPSIRVFYNESLLHLRWPKSFSFSISPSSEYSGLI